MALLSVVGDERGAGADGDQGGLAQEAWIG
jgi:hypothetical protein